MGPSWCIIKITAQNKRVLLQEGLRPKAVEEAVGLPGDDVDLIPHTIRSLPGLAEEMRQENLKRPLCLAEGHVRHEGGGVRCPVCGDEIVGTRCGSWR